MAPNCTDCAEGYYRQGDGCQQCSSDCQDRTCHRDTGECEVLEMDKPSHTSAAVGATVGILAILVLAAILVLIVIRRRKGAPKFDCARGEAETPSSSSSTESINNVHSSILTCSALRPNPADQPSGASGDQVYAVVSKSKTRQSVSTRDVVYENVTTPGVKQKKKKTNAAIKNEVKPPSTPKTSKGRRSSEGTTTPGNPLSDDEDEDLNVTDAIYANEEKPTGMRVDQLMQTVVKKLREGSLDGEFVRLPPNKDFTRKNGERKENYYKNRYNSILPYDKNRVELEQVDGDDASDYVNASFVTRNKMEKAYIAAQGPRDNTVDDLWRMVWQEGVTDIVMLTNIKEGKKSKCYEYWPAQGDRLTTGHMEVTGVEEETRAHFVVRTFDLKKSEGSDKRRVKQYHYQSWMDHEVPATTPLVNFWRYVRSRAPRTAQAPPLVVHCSAGVGRSGTFIALDIIIDHAEQKAEVNIYNTVDRLRDDRCLMVQNKVKDNANNALVLQN
ncbi:receptor-type tyrosine-protein phosphatase mu-like [Littorina saxatilis]|uniref:receptor-type tyrosine-protein phosphatase mu-like n=1 Tax=Littorina saxatilis TaxID=31220 RepID=UPI0038B56966